MNRFVNRKNNDNERLPTPSRASERSIFYYISGHGFGHATRSIEVIDALKRFRPDIPIYIRSWASRKIFAEMCPDYTVTYCKMDIGVVQKDGISMDVPETIREFEQLKDRFPEICQTEISSLKTHRAGCVVSDIPSAAHMLARSVGIPSLAVTNFSWDWIYDAWIDDYPKVAEIADGMRNEYSLCDELLRLPYAPAMGTFPTISDIPMLGRKATLPKSVVRKRLGLHTETRPLVLLSFGGMGLDGKSLGASNQLQDFRLLTTFPMNSMQITELKPLESYGIKYPDLVGAVDVVVTKPGYGIVSECAVNHTRMLYTDRGPFREYDVIMEQMPYWNCGIYIPRKVLLEGNWKHYLEDLMSRNPADAPGSTEAACAQGARVAAEHILQHYDKGKMAV